MAQHSLSLLGRHAQDRERELMMSVESVPWTGSMLEAL